MTEVLCEIRARQSGKDTLWKSAMRRRKAKTGDAVGRSSWRSPFLGAPGAGCFCGMEKFLGTGATSPLSQDPQYPGETEGKFKLLQVCPRKSVSLQGCTPLDCAQFCAHPRSRTIADGSSRAGKQGASTGAVIQHDS